MAKRFAGSEQVLDANTKAFKAGYNFGETTELFEVNYQVRPAVVAPGTYTNVTGNTALAWGLIAAAHQASLPRFLGSYPITPASDILHDLPKHKHFGVRTLQAEDEISGVGAAIGAAFGGALGVTTTSGPGLDLKSESIGLAVSLELPLVIVDVQRGGPSTGLPTTTEQSDLLHAMYGRHGESPVPIVAAKTPSHCFEAALEAVRIAVTYRTPVFLLSDGYLANGAEPWRLPDVESLPTLDPGFANSTNYTTADGVSEFWPYMRDPRTLSARCGAARSLKSSMRPTSMPMPAAGRTTTGFDSRPILPPHLPIQPCKRSSLRRRIRSTAPRSRAPRRLKSMSSAKSRWRSNAPTRRSRCACAIRMASCSASVMSAASSRRWSSWRRSPNRARSARCCRSKRASATTR